MKWMKSLLIVFALLAATSAIAAAQEGYHGSQDRQWERDHDRWHREHDRNGPYRGDGDYDADDGYYGNRGVYGRNQNPYFYQGMQEARRNGYDIGLRDGQVDRQERRSYRASTNESYRKATFGYVKAYGDKEQYKRAFRQAYERAYQRGYGAGPYRGQSGWGWGR